MGDREPVSSHQHHSFVGAHAAPRPHASLMKRSIAISGKIEPFFGTLDENVRLLEDSLHVRTHLHDTKLTVEVTHDAVDRAVKIVEEYNHATRNGRHLSGEEVKSLMRIALDEPHASASESFEHGKHRSFGKKQVTPKNATQKHYMEQIESHDMVFGIVPSGTGRTYVVAAMACSASLAKYFFNDTAATEIYTLSLHDALPILGSALIAAVS